MNLQQPEAMLPDERITTKPPGQFLHPILLLDEYLSNMDDHADACPDGGAGDILDEQLLQKQTTNSTKEETLEKKRNHTLQVADFLYGGSILEAALAVLDENDAIHRIQSESGRSAFVVKGMSRSGSRRNSSSATHYFCLIPTKEQVRKRTGIYFCSCRSYFERAKQDPKALCKHLLALKLMVHLEHSEKEEKVSDTDFAKILLNRVF